MNIEYYLATPLKIILHPNRIYFSKRHAGSSLALIRLKDKMIGVYVSRLPVQDASWAAYGDIMR